MKTKGVLIALVMLLGLCTPAPAQEPLVTAIQLKGLQRIQEAHVREHIRHQVGLPLRSREITEEIKALYQTGYFQDVRVDVEPFEGGVKLVYIFKEKPAIVSISFVGNQELEVKELREALAISPGAIADVVLIAQGADRLRKLYQQKGFGLAQVVPVLRKLSPQEVALTLLIEEGAKVKVKAIQIEGNKALSDRKIRKAMRTKERGLLSIFTKTGYYQEAELRRDMDRIRQLYYDHGYIQATVAEPQVRFLPGRKEVEITIRVSEGPQFSISEIKFRGQKAIGEAELRKALRSKPGEPISRAKLRADVARLTDLYAQRGYALATVSPELLPDVPRRQVKVVFEIQEGDIFKVGKIEISGNVRTRDRVIRREVLLNEADVFNSKLLRLSYRNINNLNFFETVKLTPVPRPRERLVDLQIQVKERPTGMLSIGGGYSSVDKLVGMVDITQANLGGRGQYIKLRGEFGGRATLFDFSFREPWLMGRPVALTVSAYRKEREYFDYSRRAVGGSLGLSRRFREYWQAGILYKFERATVFDVAEDASLVIKEQEGTRTTSSITPSVVRDSRDNFLDPHRGSRNSLRITVAGLGGDNKFLKGMLDSAWFLPLGRSTFALRARYGHATGLAGEPLPLYERFYVGGLYTIRGLGYGDAGPKDENGEPIGGERMLVLNAEFIFPLVEALRLKAVVFMDAGTAYDETPDDIRYTAGLGIRWVSPMGPIRVEWGYNIDKKPGEKQSRWEFAFGTFF